jgi:hypothetical protein
MTGSLLWYHTPTGAFYGNSFGGAYTGGHEMGSDSLLDISRVVPTANENRPVNTAVRYFMRALP